MDTDSVDQILQQWRRERPDLDPTPMGIIGRLSRIAAHLDHALSREFQRFDLARGEFDVLATLRRAGAPYQLAPTQLFRSLMLSSGAMTNRIDRLEHAGWVRRIPDPQDRRGTLVQLTSAGLTLIDQAVTAHLANEHRLLSDLSVEERLELERLLRRFLSTFEHAGTQE